MLSSIDLKYWLHQGFARRDQLLTILARIDRPATLREIRETAAAAGFRIPTKWNISSILANSEGKAIRTPDGWEITPVGLSHLQSIGLSEVSSSVREVALDLRKHLEKIEDEETSAFVSEAIKCHELGLYRSAVVMSWLGAVSVLHKYVHAKHLYKFNQESKRVDSKWKPAVTSDDLGKMNEDRFLDTIERLSLIGKNCKEALKECLKKRNGCGHPNSLKISANQSAAHIEALLLNVFEPFS